MIAKLTAIDPQKPRKNWSSGCCNKTGFGQLDNLPVALGVMDSVCGGSMGSVVGEKSTRLVE